MRTILIKTDKQSSKIASLFIFIFLTTVACKKDKAVQLEKEQFVGYGVLLEVTGGCARNLYVINGLEYVNTKNHEVWENYKDSIISSTRLDSLYNYLADTANMIFKYGDTISFKFRDDIDNLGLCFYNGSWINYRPNVFITSINKNK
ncbi:MAG: hypothetical protein ACOVK9_03145 [Bacteroidia bacterium]